MQCKGKKKSEYITNHAGKLQCATLNRFQKTYFTNKVCKNIESRLQ